LGLAQYTPKWHVGDWWVVKTWERYTTSGWPEWYYTRYDITSVEKVHSRDCYVLKVGRGSWPGILSSGATNFVLYVRIDDWLAIREVVNAQYDGKPLPPIVRDYPRGLFGPFGGDVEPRLPRFPLQLGNPDTAFKSQDRDDCSACLREISSIADPALVKRLLAEGDTLGSKAVRPSSVVYQVRNEMGSDLLTFPERDINQSLQLWCEGQPWRAYEECARYFAKKRVRVVAERSWLIAVGHGGK